MIEERIDALRKEMSEIGVDAWFITGPIPIRVNT